MRYLIRLLKMTSILFIFVLSAAAVAAERPNVVIIIADDLGYVDHGCYGSPTIRTPHLDRFGPLHNPARTCQQAELLSRSRLRRP